MYKLYWCRQTAALAPELVLEEGGIPYERVRIDLSKQENYRLDYLAINPAGVVPALATPGGEILTETAAIVLWLCEQHDLDLAPTPGHPARGEFLRWLFYLSAVVQTGYKRFYYPQRFSVDPEAAEGIRARSVIMQDDNWKIVEAHLGKHGPWLLGGSCSAADLYLAMLVTWYPEPSALMKRMPALGRCFQGVMERPVAGRVMREHGDVAF